MDKDQLGIKRRHTGSHVMSAAVKMVYPNAKRGVGPWTETEFYQDFDFGENKVSESNLKEIEKKMRWIVNKNFKIEQKMCSEKEAKEIFKGDEYKIELIDEISARGEKISLYAFIGDEGRIVYSDLCAGPHLATTGELGVFKLTRLAGAYWRGDEKNKMLTRIYGVAFEKEEELKEYEHLIEEAKKRDHRKLGKELGIYTIDPTVGLGLPLWKPKGAMILTKLRRWFEDEQLRRGYVPVYTPHIGRKALWETSGHWGFYNNSMYPPIQVGQSLADYQDNRKPQENEIYLLKPMNCPAHMVIYNDDMHSYRDLPLRMYEFGTVYRYEQKGELGGLTRVRGFTQDDAHIICRRDQVEQEMKNIIDLAWFVLKETFGFEIEVYASLRDPESDKYLGEGKDWDMAEASIKKVLKEKNLPYTEEKGEAAFYGPKMDFKVKDCLGRKWQLSTIQFDFNLPTRFDMNYINEKGEQERPFVIHRAMLGSLERFMGILIEHYAGAFPTWLAPVQAHILPVADQHEGFASELQQKIQLAGGRAEMHNASETLGKRIRNAQMQKIPFAVVIGDKEVVSGSVTVRKYGEEKDQTMKVEKFINQLTENN
ncbi:threonine--tRNA ligase [Candidatus Gracilibacteria bacterium]|nr:threonine--tRNA ligase [Candidatus Gracilibacteria bacterium]